MVPPSPQPEGRVRTCERLRPPQGSSEPKVAVRQVMEAAAKRRRGHLSSISRAGVPGGAPARQLRGRLLPRPGSGGSRASRFRAAGAAWRPHREQQAVGARSWAALQGPGPLGSRCREVRARLCGGPGRGAGRSRSSLPTRLGRRRAVGLTQASRGSSAGTPSPNTQGRQLAHTGPSTL